MEDQISEPVSPTGQFFNSSALSVTILGILESEIPIDDSPTVALVHDVFLPLNPRFSSIMVTGRNGVKQWKRVEVKAQDHINIPAFPDGKSVEFYDECLDEYMSKMAMDGFEQSRPLWEIHIFKYPTSSAAGTLVFKLHHAMGDGFSLMGALLSCLQNADNPSLPLTFPKLKMKPNLNGAKEGLLRCVSGVLSGLVNTVSDFGWSLLKSSLLEDDRTPIRSGFDGVEFRPISISTISFSLGLIKQIKITLGVTINDVITGVVFYGTRLYMQEVNEESRNAESTALVLLNTRNIAGYKSVSEMVRTRSETAWGNQFGFLHVGVPELTQAKCSAPLDFVFEAKHIIKKKRDSGAVFLTANLLETLRKCRGPEATAQHIHTTLKNSSMTVSNIIGPVEQMALAGHPIRSFYFMVTRVPQSLTITMVSYMGKLRLAVGTEKGLIDPKKYISCIEKALDLTFKAAVGPASDLN